jgi:hypothetical protein
MLFSNRVDSLFSHLCLTILDKKVPLCQLRSQYMMIKTPTKAINPTMISNLSGAATGLKHRYSMGMQRLFDPLYQFFLDKDKRPFFILVQGDCQHLLDI